MCLYKKVDKKTAKSHLCAVCVLTRPRTLALPATSKEIEVKQEEPEKEESVEPEKVEVIDSAIKDISEDVQIKEEIIETKEEIEEKTVEVNCNIRY